MCHKASPVMITIREAVYKDAGDSQIYRRNFIRLNIVTINY